MPAVLHNILRFTGLAIGVSVSSAHGIIDAAAQPALPQNVLLDGGGYNVSVDNRNVTLERAAAGAPSVNVEFWKWHSIEDCEPQPNGIATTLLPFIMQAGGGSAGGGIQVAAGTQTAATGTVVFSNSNGYTFGMSGSSRVTMSGDAFRSIIAAGTDGTATGGTLSFLNTNGVTFGIAAGVVTASVQTVGGTATGVAISAGTEVATTGAVVFSNSNQISFGLNAQTLTATFAAIKSISGGTTRATNGEVVFSNANNISFGLNGNTMTASYAQKLASVVGFTATGGETAATVTFTPALADTNYSVFGQLNGVSLAFAFDCPAGSANRSVSAFKIEPTNSMAAGDQIAFWVQPV